MESLSQNTEFRLSTESQPQNPVFRNNPGNFHPRDHNSSRSLTLAKSIFFVTVNSEILENFIFIYGKNLPCLKPWLGNELPPSTNKTVMSSFHEGLFSRNSASAKFREIETPTKILKLIIGAGIQQNVKVDMWAQRISNQSAHQHSLSRVLVFHLKKRWTLGYP